MCKTTRACNAVHVCKTMPTCNTVHVQDGVQASSVCKPTGIRQGMQACKVMQVCKTMLACKTLRVQDPACARPPPGPQYSLVLMRNWLETPGWSTSWMAAAKRAARISRSVNTACGSGTLSAVPPPQGLHTPIFRDPSI